MGRNPPGVLFAAVAFVGAIMPARPVAQEPGRVTGRTETGLYRLSVVEPGYDVTVTETERAETFSVLEMNGLVPTVTAGGVVLFRAVYDIARERKFEFAFVLPPRAGQAGGSTTRGSDGRRVSLLAKVFMTNDEKTPVKVLLGADYGEEAREVFDARGYMSVAQLASMFGR